MPKWPWSKPEQPAKREKKSFVLGTSDALGKFLILGSGGASTPAAALNLYRQSTAISIPINMIADAFSCVDLVLKVGDDVVRDHPLLRFLKQPSPYYDQELFLNVLAKDYLVTGEGQFVIQGNINRPPLRLQPISPASSSPSATQDSDAPSSWFVGGRTLPGHYVVTPGINSPVPRYILEKSNLREFIVFRNYSSRNNSLLRGESLLVAAAREARAHILGNEHNVSILENGGRVSLEFHFEEDMDDDDFEATRESLEAKYGGGPNAGKIVVTAGGKLQVSELGKTPKDMDFGGLSQVARKAVAMQYKVPLPLISDERQTLNNYAIGNLALYDQAVLPLGKRVLGGLSRALLPRYDMDPTQARIAIDQDSVTALVIRRNEELLRRKTIGIETINELRAYIGREEIQGGNELYQAAALVPVGTDLFTDDNDPDFGEGTLGGTSKAPDRDAASEEVQAPASPTAPDDDDQDEE